MKVAGGASSASHSEQQRREKFLGHLEALNKQFATWAGEQLAKDPDTPLLEASNDYLQYLSTLEERFLRTHGEVFTFGSGECGQLAHGVDEDSQLSVLKPRIVKALRDKQVRLLACGGIHSVAVGNDGRVWTWGCNDDGALGRPTGPVDLEDVSKGMKGDENHPALVGGSGSVLEGQQVMHVSCGDSQTICLTVEGNVFGWGCYKDKEGRKWFDLEHPSASPKSVKRQQNEPLALLGNWAGAVADLKCGASFNVALLKDGVVLTWGLGEVGELGRKAAPLRDEAGEYRFDAIVAEHLNPAQPVLKGGGALPVIKAVGTGMWHVFCLAAAGATVYTAGLNNYGQLGLGDDTNRDELEAVPVLEGCGVTQIGGGQHHSMALCSTASTAGDAKGGSGGRVLTWGRQDYGQLGIGPTEDDGAGAFVNSPVEVSLPGGSGGPVQMSCGENHNLVLTDKQQVFSWGFGEMGSLGHASDADEWAPKRIDLAKIKLTAPGAVTMLQVAGGGQHSMLLGRVVS